VEANIWGIKKIPFGYCNTVNKAYIKCVGGMLVKKAIEYLAYLVKHPTLDFVLAAKMFMALPEFYTIKEMPSTYPIAILVEKRVYRH